MRHVPLKTIFVATILVAGALGAFFALRRTPVCSGDGKYMATVQQCQTYGLDAGVCKEAVRQARAIAVRVAPKAATSFECETRYADCFEASAGVFAPQPAFCLSSAAASRPSEVRYLEYVSDRQSRKKTREVRID